MESAMLNEFIPLAKINTTKCINCNLDTLSIEKDDITCNSCGQEFIYINNYLKFK